MYNTVGALHQRRTVFVRHEDGAHPHVHMTVRALGADGARLTPKREDLEIWRERFAETLRDHGVDAEATSRHTRGVIVRPERVGVMRMRQRHERGEGPPPAAMVRAQKEAVDFIREGREDAAWEKELCARAKATKRIYESMARMMEGSDDPAERALAPELAAFAAKMPDPQTRRRKLADEIVRSDDQAKLERAQSEIRSRLAKLDQSPEKERERGRDRER